MSFVRNLAGVLLTSAVTAPVGLVTSILLARLLSTDDRGLYALALSFAGLTTMLFQFGWPTASIFRLRSAGTQPAEVAGGALVFLGGVFALVVAAAILLEPVLRERFLSGLPQLAFMLALATVPFQGLANGFGAIARGIDRFRYENWYNIALRAGILAAVSIALVGLGGGLIELLWAVSAVTIMLGTALIVTVARQTGVHFGLRSSEMKRSFRFGLKTYAMTLTGRVHERVDLFLLAYLLADPTQIAYFAIAKSGVQLVQILPNSLARVAYPQLAGLAPEEAASFACGLVRQGILLMLPLGVGLLVAAPILLPLVYGEPYRAATVPFVLMLPGILLLGTGRVLSRFFTGTNQHQPSVVTRGLSLAVNIVLNLLWIPMWGIAGAAAAALVSYAVDALLLAAVFLWMTDCSLADLLLPRREDVDPYRRQLERVLRKLRASA
jgi:O-antigen/teichoic acid export membrane protein